MGEKGHQEELEVSGENFRLHRNERSNDTRNILTISRSPRGLFLQDFKITGIHAFRSVFRRVLGMRAGLISHLIGLAALEARQGL